MFATVRRYEGIDSSNIDELTKKVNETLAPKLSQLPGFSSYFLIDTGNGVMSSIGLFDTSTQANESTRVASEWVRDEKLENILQNPPKVTDGEVIVHELSLRWGGPRSAGTPHARDLFNGARGTS
jgi:hypothetical protein